MELELAGDTPAATEKSEVRRKNGARGTRDIEHVAIEGMELLGKAT